MTMPRSLRLAAGIVLAIAAVYLFALTRNAFKEHSYIGRPDAERDTISISAEGRVTAVPDIATTTIGVQTEAGTVSAAQRENVSRMNAIVEALKKEGIAEEDITTTQYDIYPLYDWVDGRRVDRGYQVTQSVRVKIRDLSRSGAILALAGDLGANQVGGLNFTIDEPESVRQEARLEALAAAKEKAKALAEAAGVKLGGIVGFSESYANPGPIFYERAYGLGGDAAAAPQPSVEPGSQEVVVSVAVEYEILP